MFLAIQTAVRLIVGVVSALALAAQAEPETNPFPDKPLVAPQIHVEKKSLFRPWRGGEVPIGAYDPRFFKRHRLGTISLVANVKAHLDAVQDTEHFPSYFELISARTGKLLGKFPVVATNDGDWYFNGNGAIYLNQRHLSLCGPRTTRKFSVTEKAVVEVPQPILYVGVETDVVQNTPLYESPTSSTVVATVSAETKVTVIGMRSGGSEEATPALLVKTPFGLTGWHRRDIAGGGSSFQIYLCN
jgi:hypothetical protein